MKKSIRNPEKFETLELFSQLSQKYEYNLTDPNSTNEFSIKIKDSLEKSKTDKTLIYGKRIESMFAFVARTLGKAKLIKQEDAGNYYYSGEEITIPDYRIVLDNKTLLVEVKNCNYDNFKLKKEYYQKLKRYADSCKHELKFAIYFSKYNVWSLLSIESFIENKRNFEIDFENAKRKSEMSTIGDCFIVTNKPNIELILPTNKHAEKNEIELSIDEVKISCDNNEIKEENIKKVILYLLLYGATIRPTINESLDKNLIKFIKLTYPQQGNIGQVHNYGNLSFISSNVFRQATTDIYGNVTSIDLLMEPIHFTEALAKYTTNDDFPITRLHIDYESTN